MEKNITFFKKEFVSKIKNFSFTKKNILNLIKQNWGWVALIGFAIVVFLMPRN